MTEEEVLNIVLEVGIKKGYRVDHPNDWYGGITQKDIFNHGIKNMKKIEYNFKSINTIIRKLFNYEFLEWKFKITQSGWWNNKKNVIEYLKWLEGEMGWTKEEDWYNINRKIIKKNYGETLFNKYNTQNIPSILYSNFNFDSHKFNHLPSGYFDNFDNLKPIIIEFYNEYDRMPTYNECENIDGKNIISGIKKHGGINNIAKQIGINTTTQFKVLSGDIVRSSYEVVFANFCYLNNIQFQCEGKIVKKKKYNFDFKIGDYYIEIWGMMHKKDYCDKRVLKENVYKENNLHLISIESCLFDKYDLERINSHLISLMKEHNIKQDGFYEEDLKKLKHNESFGKKQILSELKKECIKRNFTIFPIEN